MKNWHPIHNPYRDLDVPSPYGVRPIWLMREGWERPELLNDIHSLHPATNVIGLYWAPAEKQSNPPKWETK